MDMTHVVTTVTPEIAADMLNRNTINRPLSPIAITKMAHDMSTGRWLVNPQPIIFAKDGRLLDGQHRLSAVVRSGVSIEFVIVRNAPDETFDVIDQGQPRSASQVLHVHGIANAVTVAAAARFVLRYDRFPGLVWSGVADVSKHEVIDFARSNADEFVVIGRALPRPLRKSIWAAIQFLVQRDSEFPDMWADFEEGVVTGEMLRKGDPRLTLRTQVHANRWGGGQSELLMAIGGWNAYALDKDMRQLKARRDMLPMPKVR